MPSATIAWRSGCSLLAADAEEKCCLTVPWARVTIVAMPKQFSIYDLGEVEAGSQPGRAGGSPAVATAGEGGGVDQGSLFDETFQLDVDFTEVPLPEGYRVAADEAAVAALAGELRAAGRFAFDTETDSLDPMRAQLIGLSFSTGAGRAVYVPTPHPSGGGVLLAALRRLLGPVFADASVAKIGHNLKFDLRVLTHAGMETNGADFDTMLAAQLLDPDMECGLKELARRGLGVTMTDYRALTMRGKRRLELRQLSISAVAACSAFPSAMISPPFAIETPRAITSLP